MENRVPRIAIMGRSSAVTVVSLSIANPDICRTFCDSVTRPYMQVGTRMFRSYIRARLSRNNPKNQEDVWGYFFRKECEFDVGRHASTYNTSSAGLAFEHLSERWANVLVTALDISFSGGWHTARSGVRLTRPICSAGD